MGVHGVWSLGVERLPARPASARYKSTKQVTNNDKASEKQNMRLISQNTPEATSALRNMQKHNNIFSTLNWVSKRSP